MKNEFEGQRSGPTHSRNSFSGQDTIDVQSVVDRVEELEEQRSERWVVGQNQPGYLPDAEPSEHTSVDEARACLADDMRRNSDERDEQSDFIGTDEASIEHIEHDAITAELREQATLLETMKATDGDGEYGRTIGQWHYWVTRDGFMGLDEGEEDELSELRALLSLLEGNGGDVQFEGNWYPGQLIADGQAFRTHAQDLASDIGAIQSGAVWPASCIDWDKASKELKVDYSSVTFDDTEYWYRGQ